MTDGELVRELLEATAVGCALARDALREAWGPEAHVVQGLCLAEAWLGQAARAQVLLEGVTLGEEARLMVMEAAVGMRPRGDVGTPPPAPPLVGEG